MTKKMHFIFNGSLLAVTSLLLRVTGLGFSAYISQTVGEEGTGILSLVNTVYGFGITLAVSGIFLACMRLCSAGIAKNDPDAVAVAMKKSFLHAAFFGFLAMGITCTCSAFLGTRFLGDVRTVDSIRILSFALPMIALTTVTDSYFTAVGKVYKSAISDLIEQFFKIIFGILFLKTALPFGLQASITAITKGNCIGEAAAFCASMILYYSDAKTFPLHKQNDNNKYDSLLRISLPVAVSTYARSGLVTLEHALIPRGLQAFGANKTQALSSYGIIRGMALPIVLFPASILSAFTGLLIPTFAEDHVTNQTTAINRKTSLSMELSAAYASVTASVLFVFGEDLGTVIYKNKRAGGFIRLFAPLIPFMYCDTTADSILKGLDKQLYTMIVNIIDALMSVLLTWQAIPRFGIKGYIFTVFMTEIMNFLCSAGKLVNLLKFSFHPSRALLLPSFITTVGSVFFRTLCLRFSHANALLTCIIGITSALMLSLPAIMYLCFPAEAKQLQNKLQKNIQKKNSGIPFGDPAAESG